MSFINQMTKLADESAVALNAEREVKREKFEAAKNAREKELMSFLTLTYHQSLKCAIEEAAKMGKREKYMNFNRDACKANFPTLGTPCQVLNRWLDHMVNPESEFVPEKEGVSEKDHLVGLSYDVWNNGAFTVHFTW